MCLFIVLGIYSLVAEIKIYYYYLRHHEWNKETLLEAWMNNPLRCCEEANIAAPSSLKKLLNSKKRKRASVDNTNENVQNGSLQLHNKNAKSFKIDESIGSMSNNYLSSDGNKDASDSADNTKNGSDEQNDETSGSNKARTIPSISLQCGICLEDIAPRQMLHSFRQNSFNSSFESSCSSSIYETLSDVQSEVVHENFSFDLKDSMKIKRLDLQKNVSIDQLTASGKVLKNVFQTDRKKVTLHDSCMKREKFREKIGSLKIRKLSDYGIPLFRNSNERSSKLANRKLKPDKNVMGCAHVFCAECWKSYLNVKIEEGDANDIQCPAMGCNILVDVEFIERMVTPDMAKRYAHFDIQAFVERSRNIKWCPYPGCGTAVRIPADLPSSGIQVSCQ